MRKSVSLILAITLLLSLLPSNLVVSGAGSLTEPMIYVGGEAVLKSNGTVWKPGISGPEKVAENVKWIHTQYPAYITYDNSLYVGDYIYDSATYKLDNVAAFDAGVTTMYNSFAAVKNDGSLWMWGSNSTGECCDGTTNPIGEPKYIMSDVKTVDVCRDATGILKTDGTLWVCGRNTASRLIHYSTEEIIPYPVQMLDDVKEFQLTDSLCVALKNDNTLWAWSFYSNVPTQIAENVAFFDSDSEFGEVMNMHGFTICAVKNDGSMWYFKNNFEPAFVMNGVEKVYSGPVSCYFITNAGGLYYLVNKEKEPELIEDGVRAFALRKHDHNNSSFNLGFLKTNGSLWLERMSSPPSQAWLDFYDITKLESGKWYYKTMQLQALDIQGEPQLIKGKQTTLNTVYYDENGNIDYAPSVTWYCSSDLVEVVPDGNKLTLKGLAPGKVVIEAVHNASGEVGRFELEVCTYKLTLESGYNFLIDSKKALSYNIFLGEEKVLANSVNVGWEVVTTDGTGEVKIKVLGEKNTEDYTKELSLQCLKEGDCELVATINGDKVAVVTAKVFGTVRDMVEDESVLRAKVLSNNQALEYYTEHFTDMPQIMCNFADIDTTKIYNKIDSIFKKSTNYYEIVLLDALFGSGASDDEEVYGGLLSGKIAEHITMQAAEILQNGSELVDETSKFKPIAEDLSALTDCGALQLSDVIGIAFTSQNIAEGTVNAMSELTSLGFVSNSKIEALNYLKENTSNKKLKAACESISKRYADVINNNSSKLNGYVAKEGLGEGQEFVIEGVVSAVLSKLGAGAWSIGSGTGKAVSNLLLNADDISSQTMILSAYTELGDLLSEAVKKTEKEFLANPKLETAENFIAISDIYKSTLENGCARVGEYIDIAKDADDKVAVYVWGDFTADKALVPFGQKVDYSAAKATALNTKRIISDADFYSTHGVDIAAYIGEVRSTEPSDWAVKEINEAKTKGLLPDYMCFNYTEDITRAEFCTLISNFLSEKTGKDIDVLVEEKGVVAKSPFEDTYYEYVDYIYKLGIVNGTGGDCFAPLEKITREQAATMLQRAAAVLGYDTNVSSASAEGVSDWAQSGVAFVTEKGIMKGTNLGFEPQGTYTKEQAVITFLRMFNNLK